DLRVELLNRLYKFGGGARVQAFLIGDVHDPRDRAGRGVCGRLSHLPASTRLAMVTYLRPASWAAATASGSGQSPLTLASFTSIGRLIPARTPTLGRLMTDMARLDGVPPNMSVRITTPSPVSTRFTASMISSPRLS